MAPFFTGPPENPGHHSRNVCIFAEGEVDRSATGSGVSARVALHHAKGEVPLRQAITIESILGSTMTVKAVETVNYHDYQAVVPKVSGSAHFSGENTFWLDPDDPYRDGFIFR
jgi:proline racemase